MSSHLLTHFSPSARRALAVALGGLALGPAGALAAEGPAITSQDRGARAEGLPFSPAPPSPGAVCYVDSGVDLVPDTRENVIARVALDGGTPDDVLASKHGTTMAMVGGARRNDWGMVGVWPHLRVVSVRALLEGETGFLRQLPPRRRSVSKLAGRGAPDQGDQSLARWRSEPAAL